ncbi:MAG: HEPN domain-containing protein [Deltaproteobacteria bacterium]|nr:HEPN domain-containing protein [Deltaproteobacteria bacterium]
MDEQTRVLIEIRLDRAREDMETARELVDLGRYRAAVNRAYYAIFGITTALLLTEKIERSKHTGVESALIQHFVKKELIEPEYGKIYDYIRKKREESDYSARITIDERTARKVVRDAQKYITRIMEYFQIHLEISIK